MMKAGTETGSLMNHIYSRCTNPEPQVGMGATVLMWTDRHAATIIRVTRCTITVQEDIATRVDGNGMSESQAYEYTANPQGRVTTFRKTKRGWRDSCGSGLLIGTRRKYHDYSF